MRICSGAGCIAKVADTVRFCNECVVGHISADDGIRVHSNSTTDKHRYAFLYGSTRWRTLARQVITRKPICQRCDVALSEIADHKIPAGVAIAQCKDSQRWPLDAYAGFYLLANLWALCRKCHAIKTAEDKAHVGNWPSVLDVHDAAPKRVFRF